MKRTTLIAAIALSVLAALTTSTQAGASTASESRGIVPVAALKAHGSTATSRGVQRHPGGVLLPTRQVTAQLPARSFMATLPASVDLSAYSPEVGDQKNVGACVAWTIDYAMLGWYSRHDNKPGQPFNPMYTYSQIHANNGPGGGGSRPIDALRVALQQGNDTVAHYSHGLYDFVDLPNASERANARNWRIAGYQTLFANTNGAGGGTAGASAIQAALANGKPVAIAIPIRPGFDYMAHTADALDDDTTGKIRGYHEVLAIGYDQLGVWIQNSWSTGWGKGGFGRLSWRVVAADVMQAHTISGFATNPTPNPTPTPTPNGRPVISKPDERLALGAVTGSPTAATIPVDISWSASAARGIKRYVVYLRQDSGAPARITLSSATATSQRLSLTSGHSYTVSVQAQSNAGKWAVGYATDTFSLSVVDDTPWSFTSWTRYWFADAFGGSYLASSAPGTWFSYTEQASDIGILAVKFSGGGHPAVSHDDHYDGTIDLTSGSPQGRQLVYSAHFGDASTHSVKLVTGAGWTTIDGVVLLR
jgi:hypothetical protein